MTQAISQEMKYEAALVLAKQLPFYFADATAQMETRPNPSAIVIAGMALTAALSVPSRPGPGGMGEEEIAILEKLFADLLVDEPIYSDSSGVLSWSNLHYGDLRKCAKAIRSLSRLSSPSPYIDIVFDGPPTHESGRFVEVEDASGKSINAGAWIDRGNGFWALRLSSPAPVQEEEKIENAAKYLAKTVLRHSWEGILEGRESDKGFKPWIQTKWGGVTGKRDDYRDVARAMLSSSPPPSPVQDDKRGQECANLRAILRDIRDYGGLSDDLLNRIEHALGIAPETPQQTSPVERSKT